MNKIRLIIWILCFSPIFISQVYGQNNLPGLASDFEELNPREQVEELAGLCWQNREKNSDLALKYGFSAMEIARKKGYDSKLAQLNNYTGVIYQHYKNNTSNAIPYYDQALKFGLKTGDSIEIAYVYNNLGDAYIEIGNLALARSYSRRSLEIFQNLNIPSGIAYGYVNMGYFYQNSQQYDSAIQAYQKAIEIRKKLNDSVGIASATLELANSYTSMGDFDRAIENYQNSLKLHSIINNKNYMAYSLKGMGDIFLKTGEYDSAYAYFIRALELDKERNNHSSIVATQIGIAMSLLNMNKVEEATEMINKALNHALNYGNNLDILEAYKKKAEFFSTLNLYKETAEIYQQYLEIYDSLYSDMQYRTMEEVKNRFQLHEELNTINLNLEARKKTQLLLIAIIISLLGFTFILIRLFVSKSHLSKRLEQTNQTKDKVFTIISHDLISPFNSILGFSKLVVTQLKDKNYDKAAKSAAILESSANETYLLTTKLLQWSRAQRNKIEVKPSAFDIKLLVDDIKKLYKSQLDEKEISLYTNIEDQTNVFADLSLIKTVINNLIINAIKFTSRKGEIQITAQTAETYVELCVEDNGIGISKERLQRFYSGESFNSTRGTENEKGTGIGLILCKDFVELNKGTFRIESEPGAGSKFFFTVPATKENN